MKLTMHVDYKKLGTTTKYTEAITFDHGQILIHDTTYYLNRDQQEQLLNHLAKTFTSKAKTVLGEFVPKHNNTESFNDE